MMHYPKQLKKVNIYYYSDKVNLSALSEFLFMESYGKMSIGKKLKIKR